MQITDEMINSSKYAKKAGELFEQGYNCSQAVALAFSDQYDVDVNAMKKLSSSFGGGMGRLREVCGAVTGMFMVAGLLFGYDMPEDFEGKKNHYERIQQLAEEFKLERGSIICRELLGLGEGKDSPIPEKRTSAYYVRRPCKDQVRLAATIMENYICEEQINKGYRE